MDSVTTVTTDTEREGEPYGSSELSPLAYIGMGIAMVSMGRTFLEAGIKKAGGFQGIRNMLTREIIPQLETGENVRPELTSVE